MCIIITTMRFLKSFLIWPSSFPFLWNFLWGWLLSYHGFNNKIEFGNSTKNELQSVKALLILRQKPIGNKVEVWHHNYLMTSRSITFLPPWEGLHNQKKQWQKRDMHASILHRTALTKKAVSVFPWFEHFLEARLSLTMWILVRIGIGWWCLSRQLWMPRNLWWTWSLIWCCCHRRGLNSWFSWNRERDWNIFIQLNVKHLWRPISHNSGTQLILMATSVPTILPYHMEPDRMSPQFSLEATLNQHQNSSRRLCSKFKPFQGNHVSFCSCCSVQPSPLYEVSLHCMRFEQVKACTWTPP